MVGHKQPVLMFLIFVNSRSSNESRERAQIVESKSGGSGNRDEVYIAKYDR